MEKKDTGAARFHESKAEKAEGENFREKEDTSRHTRAGARAQRKVDAEVEKYCWRRHDDEEDEENREERDGRKMAPVD